MNNQTAVHMREQIKPDPKVVDDLMNKLAVIQLEQNEKKTKKHYGMGKRAVIVAAAVVLVVFMNIPVGKTLAEEIKRWFVPKRIVEMIEGDSQEVIMEPVAQEGKEENSADYVIYVNEDIFTTEHKGGVQTIQGIADPEAQMTISQKADCSIKECLEDIRKEKGSEKCQEAEPLDIQAEYQGLLYKEGDAWNDVMIRIYCIDNGQGGCFVIEYRNTVEADEGFGSRFRSMLNTFQIIDMQQE